MKKVYVLFEISRSTGKLLGSGGCNKERKVPKYETEFQINQLINEGK